MLVPPQRSVLNNPRRFGPYFYFPMLTYVFAHCIGAISPPPLAWCSNARPCALYWGHRFRPPRRDVPTRILRAAETTQSATRAPPGTLAVRVLPCSRRDVAHLPRVHNSFVLNFFFKISPSSSSTFNLPLLLLNWLRCARELAIRPQPTPEQRSVKRSSGGFPCQSVVRQSVVVRVFAQMVPWGITLANPFKAFFSRS